MDEKTVFDPLGMTNTYVENNYRRVVPNRATSYYHKQDHVFERAVEYWGYIGSANVHATTADLLKWLTNFYAPQSGWETAFKTLLTQDKLNDGGKNHAAFGVFIEDINGYTRISHDGGTGGSRSFIGVYPKKKLNIVVLANFSSSNPWVKSDQIAELLLENKTLLKEAIDLSSIKTITLSNEQLKKFEGSYWDDINSRVRKMYVENDTLKELGNNDLSFSPIENNKFIILEGAEISTCEFIIEKSGTKKMIRTYDNDFTIISESFDPALPSKEELLAVKNLTKNVCLKPE